MGTFWTLQSSKSLFVKPFPEIDKDRCRQTWSLILQQSPSCLWHRLLYPQSRREYHLDDPHHLSTMDLPPSDHRHPQYVVAMMFYRSSINLPIFLDPDHARQYVSLSLIIVESAGKLLNYDVPTPSCSKSTQHPTAVYSVFALLFLVTYAAGNITSQIWLGVSSSIQVRRLS